MRSLRRAAGVGLVAVGALSAPALGTASGQEVGRRVAASEGSVGFTIALREGIEVCEDGVVMDGERHWGRWRNGRAGACSRGTAEVVMEVRSGRVEELEVEPWRGARSSRAGSDLGPVGPSEAASFLTGLARGEPAADRRAAERALMASVLLDDVEVWPGLLEVARDRAVPTSLRRSALFWTSQVAAESVGADLREVATDDSEEQEVREAAVFALSQRPADESIPILVEVVRTAPHPKTRRSALFWLAQHDDPRVADFFEEILTGG